MLKNGMRALLLTLVLCGMSLTFAFFTACGEDSEDSKDDTDETGYDICRGDAQQDYYVCEEQCSSLEETNLCDFNLCMWGTSGCNLVFYDDATRCGQKYNVTDDITYTRDQCFMDCELMRSQCVLSSCEDIDGCDQAFDDCKYGC